MGIVLVGAIWVGANLLDIGWPQEMQVSWLDVLGVVAVALPAYLFVAVLMALIGNMLSDPIKAEQIGPMSTVVIFLPICLSVVILNNPNGAVALILSFFPPSSLMTIALRSMGLVSLAGILADLGSDVDSFFGGFGVISVIIGLCAFPIMYGIIGAIGGAIGALLYNLIAGWIGGIEMEFSEYK